MTAAVAFHALDALLDGRDLVDAACPWCGPLRREPRNVKRKVLRLWASAGFISFHCCRCSQHGYVRDNDRRRPVNREALQRARATMAERERIEVERRRRKACWLWSQRRPIAGTPAEIYLRQARGISCPLPATLGFLPARGEQPPTLIAAFGLPDEPEPGELAMADAAVHGVHLTKLRHDGSGKAGSEPNKIMVGRSAGWPIMLAPLNDSLGLAVTEGIEDALSVHTATGLGAWAAGAASRMPALADAVPDYTEVVTIYAHADKAGQDGARALATKLHARGIEVVIEGLSA